MISKYIFKLFFKEGGCQMDSLSALKPNETTYTIYNQNHQKIGVITKDNKDNKDNTNTTYTLELFVKEKSELPLLLQVDEPIPSEALLEFLQSRVLPMNRSGLQDEMEERGFSTFTWEDLIELNQGRVYTDDFYILKDNQTYQFRDKSDTPCEELEADEQWETNEQSR